jgi:monofunctional biosynthetic peptidoglycan transglycosylase
MLAATAFGFGCLVYLYLTVPDVRPLKDHDPDITAFMQLRDREARAKGERPQRLQGWVGYNRISPHLTRAVLVAEDSSFWEHEGIDLDQMLKAWMINFEVGRVLRGGSTITQQLAKNLYLSPSRNPLRKFRELLIARRLEAELSKRRILELYLNLIEWGDGIWGAEAAARTYFGKPARAVSAPEAALMAGAIINPRVLNPLSPSERLLARQQLILRRMRYVEPPPPAPERPTGPEDAPTPIDPAALPGQSLPPEPVPPLPQKPIPIP